ncbi:hypothetical protein AVEN_238952-1 [Araneus ventricosus]|uniref:Uncharacterized protein n=1 Tax=Araneus ventricosus TaxID=182803 RepID=A0A4Y2VG24_ARAVE|nr:hypothetical protein AVEN_238952-1 [Araneus ventricosus]
MEAPLNPPFIVSGFAGVTKQLDDVSRSECLERGEQSPIIHLVGGRRKNSVTGRVHLLCGGVGTSFSVASIPWIECVLVTVTINDQCFVGFISALKRD